MTGRPGPKLPYKVLAGVEPCGDGWVIASARLLGITLVLQDPVFVPTLIDVLDMKPAYSVIALHAPIGLADDLDGTARTCDVARVRSA